MDIITAAFLIAPVMYFAILAGGILQPGPQRNALVIWPYLILIVLVQIPLQGFFIYKLFDDLGPSPTDFLYTMGRSQTVLVVALSFAQSDTLYGLIMPFVQGPPAAAYGLMAFGMLHLIATVAFLRPRIKRLALTALAAEDEEKSTAPTSW